MTNSPDDITAEMTRLALELGATTSIVRGLYRTLHTTDQRLKVLGRKSDRPDAAEIARELRALADALNDRAVELHDIARRLEPARTRKGTR